MPTEHILKHTKPNAHTNICSSTYSWILMLHHVKSSNGIYIIHICNLRASSECRHDWVCDWQLAGKQLHHSQMLPPLISPWGPPSLIES
mmetsp:Transcript_67692/g.108392  ORF Transcript_67692/g.108392 Transcript_67692/m.108392 type:complete len:89 (+) Transcript_67692:54-320(+)